MYEIAEKKNLIIDLAEKNQLLFESLTPRMGSIPQLTEELNVRLHKISAILLVDPGMAAQKMFNVGISELKTKIKTWGLKEISEIAVQRGLPKISNEEELINYKTRDIIKLSGIVGILTNANKSRLDLAYDMRNLIEHEDSHYEATNEEVQFIFSVVIDAILSVEIIEPISVTEIQELINSAEKLTRIDESLIEKYESSATFRQVQVLERLINVALDESKADIVRTNAFNLLQVFRNYVKTEARMQLVEKFITAPISKKKIDIQTVKVFNAIGIVAYVSKSTMRTVYEKLISEVEKTSVNWNFYSDHIRVLSVFEDIGYFKYCPENLLYRILIWMAELYIGTPGGYGYYGRNRKVFYSDAGVDYVQEIVANSKELFIPYMSELLKDAKLLQKTKNQYIKERLNNFIDLINS
ncbi:MAG: hypothetical protein RBR50_00805 [Candidatus Izemoplasmatales bacterium]|nr:hypothetical protein [Candidatus Izemoplasmatales bacterium]